MKEAAASRIAADLCWFFAFFCLLAPVAPARYLLALFAAACLLLGFAALRCEKAVLRFLCTLPAALFLLAAPDAATRLALGLGWLYFASVFTSGRFSMEHWAYRRAFCIMAAAALIATLYVSAAATLAMDVPVGVAGFTGAFVLLGLYTLRAIRMGISTDLGWKAYSALELILPAAAGGALFALLRYGFLHAGRVFEILFTPLAWFLRLMTDLFGRIFFNDEVDTSIPEVTDIVPPDDFTPPTGSAASTTPPPPALENLEAPPLPWGQILAVLAALLALVLLVLYIRQGRRGQNMAGAQVTEERFQVFRHRRQRNVPKDNAEQIRQCYAAYLRFLELHGQSIGRGDTSLDVLSAPEHHLYAPDEENTLRRLYLAARYGDGGSLTDADVEMAEQCFNVVKESI